MVQRRRDAIQALRSVVQFATLADWLGSDRAAEVLRALIGTNPAAFLNQDPDLAEQVVAWFDRRRRLNRSQARDLAQTFVSNLEAWYGAIWHEQVRRLLAADGRSPNIAVLTGHVRDFATIMRKRTGARDLPQWITRADADELPGLRSFINGIRANFDLLRRRILAPT